MQQHNTTQKTLSCAATTIRPKRKRTAQILGLLCAGSLYAGSIQAQGQKSVTQVYDNNDLKYYAASQVPGQDAYAMAGTLYNFNNNPGDHAAHLLMFDASSNTTQTISYNDPSFAERSLGVHHLSNNDMVIVTTANPLVSTGGDNGIQLIFTDASGNFLSSKRITVNAIGIDLWPLGSVIDMSGDYLYICGFTTPNLAAGAEPTFADSKSAFLLRYDFANNRVATMKTYDWVGGPYDYDVAHRVKILSDNTIWMGGMCNSPSLSGVAMMNMIVDPFTLNTIADAPLDMPASMQSTNLKSTSFDIWEDPANPNLAYVFSNYGGAHHSSIFMSPAFLNITSIDRNTLVPAAGLNHGLMNMMDYQWGTNIVRGNNPEAVIVSGYETFFPCGGQANPTGNDNINPNLSEMMLSTTPSGNLGINTIYRATIGSMMGTGLQYTDPNSYPDLGGNMSNLLWGPPTTVRDDGNLTDEIVLNAPVWNPAANRLNLKFLRTDATGDPACTVDYCTDNYLFYHLDASPNTVIEHLSVARESQLVTTTMDVPADATYDCAMGGSFYKKEHTLQAAVSAVSVSPNPAHDHIALEWKGITNPADKVKVQLNDVTGRINDLLYDGTINGLQQLALPNLASGVYMIRVQYNGKQLKAVPLVIK